MTQFYTSTWSNIRDVILKCFCHALIWILSFVVVFKLWWWWCGDERRRDCNKHQNKHQIAHYHVHHDSIDPLKRPLLLLISLTKMNDDKSNNTNTHSFIGSFVQMREINVQDKKYKNRDRRAWDWKRRLPTSLAKMDLRQQHLDNKMDKMSNCKYHLTSSMNILIVACSSRQLRFYSMPPHLGW